MPIQKSIKQFFYPWSQESLLYEVTTRCNLKCMHCYNVWKNKAPYSHKELSTDKTCQLIDIAIKQSRCQQFTFTGGEPLLRDDLEILAGRAAEKCRHLSLITNGSLLTEERIKSLIKAGISLFELPLNSANRDIHNQMAGDIDCFDKVVRAAADIRYHGVELAFVFVGTSMNMDQLQETLELGFALGASGFLFNRYNAGGQCHHQPEIMMPSVEQVCEGLTIAENFVNKYGIDIGASIAIPPCLIDTSQYPHIGFGYCSAGTKQAYYTIDPVGNIRPCNHTPTILGNLFESSFKKMIVSTTLKNFRQARPTFCAGCKMENECLGGCKAAAQVCYGSLSSCDPFVELNKDLINQL